MIQLVRKHLMVTLIALIFAPVAMAQMQPAKRIAPKVIKGVSLNASVDEVWTFVSQPKSFFEAISEVENLKCPAISEGAKMSFTLPNDSKREQEVSAVNKQEQVIAYYITQSDYYHQNFVYRILVGADGDKAFVQFEGIFATDSKAEDKKLKALVEGEWMWMKKALEEKFN
ncbi:MAG: hypothetical protein MI866_11540 [Bacteroidales bacterium]|nr:hypothetical protein [Bacteroidales bacterium]